MQLQRYFGNITSIVSTPPGSPANGQRHIVGSGPTGVYVGNEHKVTEFTTGVGWGFVTPTAGDGAYNIATTDALVYTGVAQNYDGIYPGSYWRPLTPTKAKWKAGAGIFASRSIDSADHGFFNIVQTSGSPIVITLAQSTAATAYMEIVLEVFATNGHSTTIQPFGGGLLRLANGTTAASIVVSAMTYAMYHLVLEQQSQTWYVWR